MEKEIRSASPSLRVQRIRESWQDPQKKAARLAKIHTEANSLIRSEKAKNYWATHPDEKAKFVQAGIQGRRDAMAERKKVALTMESLLPTSVKSKVWDVRKSLVDFAMEADLFWFLPDNYRMVLGLHYFIGGGSLSMEEIGESLSISRQLAWKWKQVGLRMIELMLEGELIPQNGVVKLRGSRPRKI